MKHHKFSPKSLERMVGVDTRLKLIAEYALKISTIDFGIPGHGGLRTQEEQMLLFTSGLSKCDGIEKLSKHQSGRALDFYAYVDGEASWDKGHLTSVAAAFLQSASQLGYAIEWGGFWTSFVDMPHIQLKDES